MSAEQSQIGLLALSLRRDAMDRLQAYLSKNKKTIFEISRKDFSNFHGIGPKTVVAVENALIEWGVLMLE